MSLNSIGCIVRLRLPCGHIVANIQCGKAFDLAALEAATINIKCQSETRTECPLCRNIITVPCWARSSSAWETIKSHVPALAMSADSSAAFFYIRQSALAALPRDDLMSELVAILLSSCTGTIQASFVSANLFMTADSMSHSGSTKDFFPLCSIRWSRLVDTAGRSLVQAY